MFSDQFYEDRLSASEQNMKLLLETVMCIMHCRKYDLHNCNRDFLLHNYNKNCYPHICSETVTCICAPETSTCIIATETSTCIIVADHQHTSNKKYHLKTCKNARDIVTCIIGIESVSDIVPTETVTCRIDYRNFHSQKWCQSEILLVTIKKLSKRVSTNFKANSFSTPCIT